MGSVIAENSSWRWAFWTNFPFCAVGLFLTLAFVKLNSVARLTIKEKLIRTDWIGAILFIGGMTSTLVGISWAGV